MLLVKANLVPAETSPPRFSPSASVILPAMFAPPVCEGVCLRVEKHPCSYYSYCPRSPTYGVGIIYILSIGRNIPLPIFFLRGVVLVAPLPRSPNS